MAVNVLIKFRCVLTYPPYQLRRFMEIHVRYWFEAAVLCDQQHLTGSVLMFVRADDS